MSKMKSMIACALLVAAAFWISAACGAQSAFDGTWKIVAEQSKLSPKPHVFYISQGWYHCTSCNPEVTIMADGTDQPRKGEVIDTLSVQVVDPYTFQEVGKKGGKVISEHTRTVSKDGRTLTVKSTFHPMNSSQPVVTEATFKRVGVAPLGVHAASGQWQIVSLKHTERDLVLICKVSGDQVAVTDPNGETYTAKLDGGDAPVQGAYGYDTVSLKKIGPNKIEETDKRNGTVVDVSQMTVSGKTMTIVDTNPTSGRVSTYVAHKE